MRVMLLLASRASRSRALSPSPRLRRPLPAPCGWEVASRDRGPRVRPRQRCPQSPRRRPGRGAQACRAIAPRPRRVWRSCL